MRRFLLVLVVVILGCGLAVVGCGGDGDSSTETSGVTGSSEVGETSTSFSGAGLPASTTSPSASTTPSTSGPSSGTQSTTGTTMLVFGDFALWDQTIKYEGTGDGVALNITVNRPEDLADAGGMTAPKDNRLVGMRVAIANQGAGEVDVSPDWFQIRDLDGEAYESIIVTNVDFEVLDSDGLKGGETVEGYVCFELPDDAVVNLAECDFDKGEDAGMVLTWSD